MAQKALKKEVKRPKTGAKEVKFRAGGSAKASKSHVRHVPGDGYVCDALELAVRQMNKGLRSPCPSLSDRFSHCFPMVFLWFSIVFPWFCQLFPFKTIQNIIRIL